MEGLVSFILFAVVFYFLMRFGCGAHMMHGNHGDHGGDHQKGKSQSSATKDPVCGMPVADDVGYGKLHQGVLYRFCSRKCLDEFDIQPEKYVESSRNVKSLKGEHHHGA